jgi:hypothetical protein
MLLSVQCLFCSGDAGGQQCPAILEILAEVLANEGDIIHQPTVKDIKPFLGGDSFSLTAALVQGEYMLSQF